MSQLFWWARQLFMFNTSVFLRPVCRQRHVCHMEVETWHMCHAWQCQQIWEYHQSAAAALRLCDCISHYKLEVDAVDLIITTAAQCRNPLSMSLLTCRPGLSWRTGWPVVAARLKPALCCLVSGLMTLSLTAFEGIRLRAACERLWRARRPDANPSWCCHTRLCSARAARHTVTAGLRHARGT